MVLSRRARAFSVLWSSAVLAGAFVAGAAAGGGGACAEAVASDSTMTKTNFIGSCKGWTQIGPERLPRTCQLYLVEMDQPASTAPPLTLKTSPEMNPAISVQRKTMGPAISAGVATRPRGMVPRTAEEIFASASAPADMSVSTHPGATQFT